MDQNPNHSKCIYSKIEKLNKNGIKRNSCKKRNVNNINNINKIRYVTDDKPLNKFISSSLNNIRLENIALLFLFLPNYFYHKRYIEVIY